MKSDHGRCVGYKQHGFIILYKLVLTKYVNFHTYQKEKLILLWKDKFRTIIIYKEWREN